MKFLILLLLTNSFHVHARFENNVSRTTFRKVLGVMKQTFSSYAELDGRELVIYADYNQEWAQAFARRWETDQLIVYGGIAKIPGSTEDSFALFLCHEIGHLYAGAPYSDAYNRIAVEGQADYWATQVCFPKIVNKLTKKDPSRYSLKECRDNLECARALDASLIMTAFFADNRNIPHPRIETPDTSEVTEVSRTHPEPQCRLDTLWAGIRESDKPRCWFAPTSYQ